MRKFPPDLLQKIRDAVNIVDIVGEHVVLRKAGSNHMGLCPFHSERSPSFSVSENKQLYHCFGCKKSGDLISFTMEIHGLSFPEAVEELADRARVALPRDLTEAGRSDNPEEEKRRNAHREKIATAWKLNRFAAAFYHNYLSKFSDAERYLALRGVKDDLRREFYVGAVSREWDLLAKHLVSKKAPLALAVELGLIRPSTKGPADGPGYFDLFRNRAMFPILDMRGKVAGFGGRTLPSETADEGPKYLNSPESVLFQKSKLAYGLFQAQKHIREKDELILVEGYFDVLALHAAGFRNVVASCGTALTADHLALFKRFASRITILFDGDKAGVSATDRAMELGLDHGMVLHGAAMPEGLDPDEVLFDPKTGQPLPEGRPQMEAILGAARPLIDARIEQAGEQAVKGPEDRTQAIKRVSGWLARFNDPVGREVRVQEVQKRLGISREILGKSGVPVGVAVSRNSGPKPQVRATPSPKKLPDGERVLIFALAQGGEPMEIFLKARDKLPPEQMLPDLFEYPPARQLIELLLENPQILSRPQQGSEGIAPQIYSVLSEAWMTDPTPFATQDFRVALDRAQGRIWARFSQRIKAALADAEAKKDAGLHSKLMKDYLDVQRKMKEFNCFYDEA